jgi:hypothetical protein
MKVAFQLRVLRGKPSFHVPEPLQIVEREVMRQIIAED